MEGTIALDELNKREKDGLKLPTRFTFQSPRDAERLDDWMKLFEELVMRK